MTLEISILNNLKKLPYSMKQAVFLYTEFLVNRITDQGDNSIETLPKTMSKKRGGLGVWQGKVWIADDFDAPLDDFQEYMS
ncbi:DUF2281 domain-containing protein [Spirulina major CS-329]|uniref:type II toxin-antitoxin system VapB family antitoxin n=1 Tax=Spirulina TaxID=1154 RepID=UPI00232B221A|nr:MULTISPECIES: DUF2281 domain-containing protein [Spirulina]MDB9494361.1 DUF2281 domain-containing protein [Spirulina subsalsa CS-330]MDB9501672.1 DUF2281 domain-containing protein [Spirulina major CS-329]